MALSFDGGVQSDLSFDGKNPLRQASDQFDDDLVRPATPPRDCLGPWDRPPGVPREVRMSIDILPPMGNASPPPKKVLSESNKESMYYGGCLMEAVRQVSRGTRSLPCATFPSLRRPRHLLRETRPTSRSGSARVEALASP